MAFGGSATISPAMATPAATLPAAPTARPRAIAVWLLAVAALVFVMVVVGGITRLTESGLSIVRWEPISGAIPPIGDEAWAEEFAAYRQSPQYQLVNSGMSLADFKTIYFWEYVHRLLGRLIGLAFALAARLVRLEAGDPERLWLEARRPARARRAAGRDRLVDGRLRAWSTGPTSATSASPSTCSPRSPSSARLLWVALDLLGLAEDADAAAGADADARRSGRCRCCSCRFCSAPMSPGSTPATPIRAGRRWARNGFRPTRRCWSPGSGTSSTIRSWSSSSTAGSPSPSRRPPWWLARNAWVKGIRRGGRDARGRGRRSDPARHPDPPVGRRAVDRCRAPGHGVLLLGGGVWSPPTGSGSAGHERDRHRLRDLRHATRKRGGSPGSWSRNGSPPAPTSSAPAIPSIAGRARSRRADEVAALFKTRATAPSR